MKRNIVKDIQFLSRKSTLANKNDSALITDLKDTLTAHSDECIGLAANMIGALKQVIIVDTGDGQLVMINPEIKRRSGKYETQESCLSLLGSRRTIRYKEIEVKYQNEDFKTERRTFTGITAQAIQHECDHLKGVII